MKKTDTEIMFLADTNPAKRTSRKDRKIAVEACEWAYSPRNWKLSRDIYEAYKTPSVYKVRAWERCKRLCAEMGGFDLAISAAGCQTFSVVFKYTDSETGELCCAYITRDYDRFAPVGGARI